MMPMDATGSLLGTIKPQQKRDRARSGLVTSYNGLVLECDGFPVSVGSVCQVDSGYGQHMLAEVIGFGAGKNQLVLYEPGMQLHAGAKVTLVDEGVDVPVGDAFLGRAIDGLGAPIDGRDLPQSDETWSLNGRYINPLNRSPVVKVFDVGVRAVNGLLTMGLGQRVGIIAGSGVGKSVMLSMMVRYAKADAVVVGLIGERGREVGDFLRQLQASGAMDRVCLVAEPADRSALLRLRAARRATAMAEALRDQGKHVLLIMDSLTRVAHARREIGLGLGEMPTMKGYPTSALAEIPKLVERAGGGDEQKGGSITGIYTVLADGDDGNDPVVDSARAILDGHIVLSRKFAQMGLYPAIDLGASVSRVMNDVVPTKHAAAASMFRKHLNLYLENRDLMLMGGYAPGQDQELDAAVNIWPKLQAYIKQSSGEESNFLASSEKLMALTGG